MQHNNDKETKPTGEDQSRDNKKGKEDLNRDKPFKTRKNKSR